MKFSQLKIGERFYYRNACYTKTGPLQAIEEGAVNPQLIMRSAMVQTSAGENDADLPVGKPTDRLHQAVDRYHNECKAILRATVGDAQTDALDSIEKCYRELLRFLDKA